MQSDFRAYLQQELIRRTGRNPRYSARAFARTLDTDFSTLSKILSGKRTVGRGTITRLGTRLGLKEAEIQSFIERGSSRDAGSGKRGTYRQVALDHFQVIADWQHYAILELMRVETFRPDRAWVARCLGLSMDQVIDALERLQRVGLLEITPTGRWVDLSEGRSTTLGAKYTAQAFRQLQHQILARAREAMESVPIEQRDQTSMTMAIDVERLPEAKRKLTEFRRELARFLSRGEKRQEVYHLSFSLYPVSRCGGAGPPPAAGETPQGSR